jgi:hypothetical protein
MEVSRQFYSATALPRYSLVWRLNAPNNLSGHRTDEDRIFRGPQPGRSFHSLVIVGFPELSRLPYNCLLQFK